ncbi:hypothetical protein Catovirus_1_549 [Catovirus CTV1]|uniref:Uncharacterized protein n=1 Tax=Catovirus CTV1 TaxID=1977631 RepID=A0A1V0S9X6_9VIRU|nr:hypothetical protein Catovirus_1_549 [Catovirus CTV1]
MTEVSNIHIQESFIKPVVIVDKEQYEKLVKENRDLNIKILELANNERKLMELVDNGNKTIEILQKENKELKEKLSEMELKYNQIKNTLDDMLIKEKYNKMLIAIQDLNKLESLELNEPKLKQNLKRLRNICVSECHYLVDDDDEILLGYKRKVLYEKLVNMDNGVKHKMNSKFPGLIDDIKPLIECNDDQIPQEELEYINEWWE